MAKYLNETGLAYFWGKIKTYVSNAVKVTGVKGNAETSYRTGNVNITPANVGAVAKSGNETVAGNKTFTGTTVLNPVSEFTQSVNTVIHANAAAIIQSPIPKYLWHDLFAFCRATTPIYYTTSDGTAWTEATLNKNLFIHKEAWGTLRVLDTNISGSRWEWVGGGFAYCRGNWLVLGVAYANPIAKFDLRLQASSGSGDSATWTDLANVTGISASQEPIWIRTSGPSTANIRLTITRNSESASTTPLPLVSIRWLTARWGDQGKGSEFEYPYTWNTNFDIAPLPGGSFIGNLTGTATKATQDGGGNNIAGTYSTIADTVTAVSYNNSTKQLSYTKNGASTVITSIPSYSIMLQSDYDAGTSIIGMLISPNLLKSIVTKASYYNAGDTITLSGTEDQIITTGFANGTKSLIFTLPLNKPVNASSVSFTNLTISARQQGTNNNIGDVIALGGTINSIGIGQTTGLRIALTLPSSSSISFQTNYPAVIAISAPTSFTFS